MLFTHLPALYGNWLHILANEKTRPLIKANNGILRVARQSVHNWRDNYQAEGLKCLEDKPRSGRPIELDGKLRAKITALACSPAPDGRARWDLRLLAEKVVELEYCETISHTQVNKILKKMNSNPTSKRRGV